MNTMDRSHEKIWNVNNYHIKDMQRFVLGKCFKFSQKTLQIWDGNLGQEHNKSWQWKSGGGGAVMAMERLTRPLVVVRRQQKYQISGFRIYYATSA